MGLGEGFIGIEFCKIVIIIELWVDVRFLGGMITHRLSIITYRYKEFIDKTGKKKK